MTDTDILESLTKSVGFVMEQMVKCGKKTCKCAIDPSQRHGPYYYYRFWKFENGKYVRKKMYIDFKTYEKLGDAIEIYRGLIAGSQGSYKIDRNRVIEALLNRTPFNKEALKNFEFKVSDVFKLYPEGYSASVLI